MAEADQRHLAAYMAMQRGGQERSRLGHDISMPQVVRWTLFKISLCVPLSFIIIFYGVYILSFLLCFMNLALNLRAIKWDQSIRSLLWPEFGAGIVGGPRLAGTQGQSRDGPTWGYLPIISDN